MSCVRIVHSRLRIGLFTLTLGLAFVWMTDTLALKEVYVDLPFAASADVLPVFVKKSRFTGLAGGGGSHGCGVCLREVESKSPSELRFRLTNHLEETVYLPRRVTDKKSSVTVPYFVECQESAGGPISVLPSTFEFSQTPTELKPDEELILSVPVPATARSCAVVVPFVESETAAVELAEQNPFTVTRESDFLESVSGVYWVVEVSEPRY